MSGRVLRTVLSQTRKRVVVFGSGSNVARHPRAAFYENGTGTPLFNGEGELIILDFDGDRDPDIVDSVSYTYVLINDGQGIFSLKQHTSFPEIDRTPAHLWPVDINRKGLIDFISHRTQCDATSCTTSCYQVVD
jgi:hypothetical protein